MPREDARVGRDNNVSETDDAEVDGLLQLTKRTLTHLLGHTVNLTTFLGCKKVLCCKNNTEAGQPLWLRVEAYPNDSTKYLLYFSLEKQAAGPRRSSFVVDVEDSDSESSTDEDDLLLDESLSDDSNE